MKRHQGVDDAWDAITAAVAPLPLRALVALLPQEREDWGDAIQAELASVPGAWHRVRFAASASAGILRMIAYDGARGRVADGRAVAAAVVVGIVAGTVDLIIASRLPMMLAVSVAGVMLGIRHPRAAWRWPLLTGGMLPALIAVTGFAGPYAFDRADQWLAPTLALISTIIGVACGRGVRAMTRRA